MAAARHSGRRSARSDAAAAQPWWRGLPRAQLLDVRLCDLGLAIEDTPLDKRIAQLGRELERVGLRFKPRIWLADDWFSPNRIDGFAVPFYLAHPRLARIERETMFEVEGGSHTSCMKLLRHETGHAIDNAYRLHRRKLWRQTFGLFGAPYRDRYIPRPTSTDHVHNLDHWYAQSHPSEDFAETFAAWLDPRSRWRERYAEWPALRKLEVVDQLMREISSQKPRVRSRARPDALSSQRITLREYYTRKRRTYRDDHITEYDEPLARLFDADAKGERADRFLERHRAELRTRVHAVTAQHSYLIDQVMGELVRRCRSQRLRRALPERDTLIGAAVLLTSLTMDFLTHPHGEYQR